MPDWAIIDVAFPYCGPCAFCGGPDKRHRLFDAMRGAYRAGDSVEAIADNYNVPVDAVRAVITPERCPLRRKVRHA
jgi:hypothetical protein